VRAEAASDPGAADQARLAITGARTALKGFDEATVISAPEAASAAPR
jgi:hypothetical protein